MKQNPREILSSIAAESGKRIVDALGTGVVRSIFVTGSLPRGEISWFDRGDRLEIYSDVDISVVVEDDAVRPGHHQRPERAIDRLGQRDDVAVFVGDAEVRRAVVVRRW